MTNDTIELLARGEGLLTMELLLASAAFKDGICCYFARSSIFEACVLSLK
ncbi:hypothetical protein TSAR_010205 [Trichomalopsis sarcophagae]|uniref:Uncharacterized protein n=1 Tax=Trichomalopsis sarcophagae TaxID=543379 RepID=A0A232EZB1_9HYME|nr:hypothetical protein TSAR_010205 [Trichomalopsis sarcophagae]